MFEAGKASNACKHITVLDPVGAGATDLRTNTCKELLEQIHFDANQRECFRNQDFNGWYRSY